MIVKEKLDSIRSFSKKFPKNELEYILDNFEDYKDELIESIKYVTDNWDYIKEKDDDYFLHMYSLFLFGQKECKEAFPSIINLLKKEDEQVEWLLGDLLTETLCDILYYTFDGDLEPLTTLIYNVKSNQYARLAAFNVYCLLYKNNLVDKEKFLEFIDKVLSDFDRENIITDIVFSVAKLGLLQFRGKVKELFERNLIDTYYWGDYDSFIDIVFSDVEYENFKPSEIDIVRDFGRWAAFEQENKKNMMQDQNIKLVKKINNHIKKPNKPVKIGRNEPCPCGSGKKYKKCCIDKKVEVEETLDYENYIIDSMRDYPRMEKLLEYFDQEAIEIDRLMYNAIVHKAIPIFVKRNIKLEFNRYKNYLDQGFKLLFEKCKNEDLKTLKEYDDKHSIHYTIMDCYIFYYKLIEKLIGYDYENEEQYISSVNALKKDINSLFNLNEDEKNILAIDYDFGEIE